MLEERHNSKLGNFNYSITTAVKLPVFWSMLWYKRYISACKTDRYTAIGQYVSMLHQAKCECFNIKIFCPVK